MFHCMLQVWEQDYISLPNAWELSSAGMFLPRYKGEWCFAGIAGIVDTLCGETGMKSTPQMLLPQTKF